MRRVQLACLAVALYSVSGCERLLMIETDRYPSADRMREEYGALASRLRLPDSARDIVITVDSDNVAMFLKFDVEDREELGDYVAGLTRLARSPGYCEPTHLADWWRAEMSGASPRFSERPWMRSSWGERPSTNFAIAGTTVYAFYCGDLARGEQSGER